MHFPREMFHLKTNKKTIKGYLSPAYWTFVCMKITHWLSYHLCYYHIRPVKDDKVILFQAENRKWKNTLIQIVSNIKLFYGIFKIVSIPWTYETYGVSSILALHFISLIQLSMSIVSGHNAQNKFIKEVDFIHKNFYKIFDKLRADGKEIKYWWEHTGPQIIIVNTVTHYWMTRIVYVMVFLVKPEAPLYLFRFIPDILRQNYLALLSYGMFELWMAGSWLDLIIVTGAFQFEYQVYLQSVLKILRFDESYTYDYKIQIYRRLQILNRMFSQFFSNMFFSWQVILIFYNIMAIYVTLYLFESMLFLMWLLFPLSIVSSTLYMSYLIGQFSKLDEISIYFIENMKQKYTHFEPQKKLLRKQLTRRTQILSLDNLEMQFGQFGILSPELIIFVMDQIVGNFLTLKDAMGK